MLVISQLEVVMPKRYFHVVNNQRFGPFSSVELKGRASSGIIGRDHFIQEEGLPTLHLAREVRGLFTDCDAGGENTGSVANPRSTIHRQPDPSTRTILVPRFKNPISSLLNNLTSSVLDLMHARVDKGELTETQFEQLGRGLLVELQSALAYAEALPLNLAKDTSRTTAGAATINAGEGSVAADEPKARPNATQPGNRSRSGNNTSKQSGVARLATTPQSQQAMPTGNAGASALQMGVAALAGGAWGYLIGRQGGMGSPLPHGYQIGETHIHYHGDDTGVPGQGNELHNGSDYTPVSFESSENAPTVIGADTNSDGLIDSFYGDTDADNVVDVMGTDTDADGDIDRVSIDTDDDGTLDRTFVEESSDDSDGPIADAEQLAEGDEYGDDWVDAADAESVDVGGIDEVVGADLDFGDFDF
jgi:hypothetical protein